MDFQRSAIGSFRCFMVFAADFTRLADRLCAEPAMGRADSWVRGVQRDTN